MRTWVWAVAVVSLIVLWGCERGGAEREGGDAAEVEIDDDLGSLQVTNRVDEPVAVYFDGQELYTVPPGRSYTFRNLPIGKVTLYGVGRISERHYGLPELDIEEGGDYEWTINP